MIENYEVIDEAIKAAENADGSALEENLRYMESIEGKISQFTNEVQEFWHNLIDSEVVKEFVDAGTKLINILDDILSGVTKSGAINLITSFLTGTIDFIALITSGLGELSTVLAGVLGLSIYKGVKEKNSGGRDKKFSLIIKYATESFSREVCEF